MNVCKICNSDNIKTLYRINSITVLKCKTCGFIFQKISSKKWNRKKIKSIYNCYTKRLEYTYLKYRQEYEKISQKKLHIIKRYKKNGKLLDIGCGWGYFLNLARKNGFKVEGIDISKYAVNYARKHFNIKIKNSSILETSYKKETFDVVTSWDFIEHIDNPQKFISIVFKILKENGIFCLETPNVNGLLFKLAHIIYFLSFDKIDFAIKELFYPLHLIYFSTKTIKNLLNTGGFTIKKLYKKSSNLNIIFSEDSDKKYTHSKLIKNIIKILSLFSDMIGMGNKLVVYAIKDRKELNLKNQKSMFKKKYNEILNLYKKQSLQIKLYFGIRSIGFSCLSLIEKYIPKQGKIVDLGCGYGFVDNLFYQLSPGRKIYAYDLIENRLTIGKLIDKEKKIKFIKANILNFKQAKCDAIFMIDVFCYLNNDKKSNLLKKCYNSLNSTGILIINDFSTKPKIKYLLLVVQEFLINNIRFFLGEKMWEKIYKQKLFILNEKKLADLAKKNNFSLVTKIDCSNILHPHVLYIFKKN